MTYEEIKEAVDLTLALNDEDNRASAERIAAMIEDFLKEYTK